MQKQKKDNQFLKKAYYEGGNKAFREFVVQHLKYPKEALEKGIEGIVQMRIEIDHKGNVKGAKVIKGIGFGCDEEAVRIIKLAKYVVPKSPRKLRVKYNKNVRIQFKKPKKKKKKIKIEYKITPTVKLPEKKSDDSSSGYNYVIKF